VAFQDGEGGALQNAIADLVVLPVNGENIMEAIFTSSVLGAERVLEQVVLSEVHYNRYAFVVDSPSLDDEYLLLKAALDMDGELYQDETISVEDLVHQTRLDVDVVRRVLCHWIDDAVAYISTAQLDPECDREPIVLLEKAKRRAEDWDRYRTERQRMKRFTLTLNIPRPFPNDAVNLIRSIGLSSHLHFTEVLAAPQAAAIGNQLELQCGSRTIGPWASATPSTTNSSG
jgi:hypothetical protein